MIIGLSGLIGSGKNTVASYIVEQYGYTQLAFADSVKDCVACIFNWPRELLEGDTEESREWRETIDSWWANKLQISNFTPRWALQNISTEILKKYFNDDIWLFSLENKLLNYQNNNIIITDCRFLNELELLKNWNCKFLKITRSLPYWYKFINFYNDTKNEKYLHILESIIHRSEWEWLLYKYDYEIFNDSSKENLYLKVDKWYNEFLKNP